MGGALRKDEKKPKSRITEQDKAILQLKQMRDKLKKYQDKIELQMAKDRALAKELLNNGRVDKAKLLLKKKKFYESNLEKTDGQLENLDSLVNNIEFTMVEHQVVNGLKVGNECLKKLHEMMSIDEIEDIMDDTKDAIEHQNRIDELVSGQFAGESFEEEINEELDALLAAQMPEVPADKIPEATQERTKKEKIKTETKRVAMEAD